MSLPVLHPEKVLGTRGPRGVWSGLSIYPMQKFLDKRIQVVTHRDGVNTSCVSDLLNNFIKDYKKSPNIFTFSDSFKKASSGEEIKTKLYSAAKKFLDDNGSFNGSIIYNPENGYYFHLGKFDQPLEVEDHKGETLPYHYCFEILAYSEKMGEAKMAYGFLPIELVHGKDGVYLNSAFSESFISLFDGGENNMMKLLDEPLSILGHRADPTIIPHVFKPSRVVDRHPDETTPLNIEKYSIKITYVTPATFKDRTYRILNSGVKGHVRKQKVGPGRLSVKEVFVKEHERKYSNERTKP